MLEPTPDNDLTDGHTIARTVSSARPKEIQGNPDSRVGSMGYCHIEGEGVIGETGIGIIAWRIDGRVDPGVFRDAIGDIAAQLQCLTGASCSGSHDG